MRITITRDQRPAGNDATKSSYGQAFDVSATGSTMEGAEIAHWRDDVDAAVAANIIARMNR